MTNLQGVTDLIARLQRRAESERAIQANNEAVATALRGQKLLFDQGFRSPSITFAMRLGLDHENCAKNDAALAADWDEAAAALTALSAEAAALRARVAELTRGRDEARRVAHKAIDMGQKAGIERMQAEAKVARLEEKIRDWEARIDDAEWSTNSSLTEGIRAEMRAALTEGDTNG
jgi:hypothetical protein